MIISYPVFGQRIESPYEIGKWQGFKPAAISYTFDDNCTNQLAVAVPLFNKYAFKVTLFTVIKWNPNWAGLQAAANNGHEIASHTVNHPSLDSINDINQQLEYRDSKKIINNTITGQECVTLAYPFCSCGNSLLCSEYYIAARSCDGFLDPPTPPNFMCISSIGCGTDYHDQTAADLNARVESAIPSGSWCVFMLHDIDNIAGYSSQRSDELGQHLKFVASNSSQYWVNTFGNVVRYIKERNAVTLIVEKENSNQISLLLKDTLDNKIYNYPVSIRRTLPKGWKGASIKQVNIKLSVKLIQEYAKSYIQFDAIPNMGLISIKRENKALQGNK